MTSAHCNDQYVVAEAYGTLPEAQFFVVLIKLKAMSA